MPSDRALLRAYYAQVDEWSRLEGDEGWLELIRTLQLIDRHIPPASRVLDLGGGPGRYAIEMVRRGHRVTLLDVSAHQVQEAQRRVSQASVQDGVDAFVVGDAADLSEWRTAPFDAVLALGPLYHAADLTELEQLIEQIASVLRPGGVVIGAFIPRMSGLSGLLAQPLATPSPLLRPVLETGVLPASAARAGAFFPHPAQVSAAFHPYCDEVGVFSLRGLGSGYGAQLRALQTSSPAVLTEALSIIDATSARPDVIGLGWHAVYVGRRREAVSGG